MRASLLLALALLAVPHPADADDEGSEHTAQLVGAERDTLGVTVAFDARTGWSMTVRPRPGAAARSVALPDLPTDHAHFLVMVAPGRNRIAFVMQSGNPEVPAGDGLVWLYQADGKLLRRWTFGALFGKDERATFQRSISHVQWIQGAPEAKGAVLTLRTRTRALVIDTTRQTVLRR